MMPDLEIQSARQVSVGAHNDAILVSSPKGNWVFRFTRNEVGRLALVRELSVLDSLKGRTPLPVPVPILREADAIVYPMLEGEPLTCWTIISLDEKVRQRLADQLGSFLRELHSTPAGLPVPENSAEDKDAMFDGLFAQIREKLFPHLESHQRAWIERLEADGRGLYAALPPEQACALIYNDFKIGHVLFDPLRQEISGIIDFGIACYDTPDIDICNLMQCFGETFVTRTFEAYPAARQMLPRARLGVWVMELWSLVEAITEARPQKACVNVAIPRDIQFPILP